MSMISIKKGIVCCFFLSLLFSTETAVGCTNGFPDMDLIITRASRTTTGVPTNGLSLLKAFNCSGTITALVLGVDVRTENGTHDLYPEVSLQRPIDLDEPGPINYEIVSGSERTIRLTPANFSTSGAFDFPLDPPLEFQANDVLAWNQPDPGKSVVRMYAIDGTGTTGSKSLLIYPVTDSVTSCTNQQALSEQAGLVTKWIIGGEPRMPKNPPELQLWRRADAGARYSKTGVSSISSIPNRTPHTNVYEYVLDPPLEFQKGDIFGLYKPRESESVLNIFLQEDNGPFAYGQESGTNLPLSRIRADSTNLLDQNDYPMVSVEIALSASQTDRTTITASTMTDPSTTATIPEGSNTTGALIAFGVIMAVIALVIVVMVTAVIGSTLSKGKKHKPLQSSISDDDTETPYNRVTDATDESRSMLRSTMSTKSFTFTGRTSIVTNPVSKLLDGAEGRRNVFRSGRLKTSLMGEAAITNPVYKVVEGERLQEEIPSDNTRKAAVKCSAPASEPVYLEARSTYKKETPIKSTLRGKYVDVGYSEVCKVPRYSPIVVPTMAERQNKTQEEIDLEHNYAKLERQGFFVESEIYWNPGTDCSSIYEQLAQKRYREIARGQIKLISHLGSGQFGQVSKGLWYSPAGPKEVAIKTLNDEAAETERVKFLQEAAIMGQFHHPNVLKLHGVVTVGEPVMIVLELMKNGDLEQYLQSLRQSLHSPDPEEKLLSSKEHMLLSFCCQIALGMEYLSKKSFVHRDLAARNILVSAEKHCKIADFGMSRDLQNEHYYKSTGGRVPVKWTAPEAIRYKKYSTASDVWSFGILMYEIWSLGHQPFEGMTNHQTFQSIMDGYRLPPPPGCPDTVYELMIKCWHPETMGRPSFSSLVANLSQPGKQNLMQSEADQSGEPQDRELEEPLESGTTLYSLL